MALSDLPSLELFPYPTTVVLCLTKENWDGIKSELKCTDEDFLAGAGACMRSHGYHAVVCHDATVDHEPEEHAGLLTHELTHCWQKLLKDIGEDEPSDEFMAYTLQALVQWALLELKKVREECSDSTKSSPGSSEQASSQQPLDFTSSATGEQSQS